MEKSNMLLTKEQFSKYIQHVQESLEIHDKIYDTLSDKLAEEFIEKLEKPGDLLLKACFNEEQVDYIEWWLWDAPKDNKTVHITNMSTGGVKKSYSLNKVEDLYSFLKTECRSEDEQQQ